MKELLLPAKYPALTLLLMLLLPPVSFGGNTVTSPYDLPVSGRVTDAATGEGLPGANVGIKGSATGTTTNTQGDFALSVPNDNTVLVFSYVGYEPREVTVGNRTTLNVALTASSQLLNQVVVIGYGRQTKRDVTTAIASVKAADIKEQPLTGFDQAITGKLAGVQVAQTSGAPGGNISIRVRGTSSISAGNNPLYVVDGIPLSNDLRNATGTIAIGGYTNQNQPINPLNTINVNDIESIEVLKDASSAAIYGSRGSNGVVIITTKKGKAGKPVLGYETFFGVQEVSKKLELLDAYQYAQLVYDGHNNSYLDNNPNGSINDPNAVRTNPGWQIPPEVLPYLEDQPGLTNTDWQDEIFRRAPMQSHTLSLAGGTDKTRYYVSGNYVSQDGVVISSGFKRYGGQFNVETGDARWKAGFTLNPSFLDYDLVNSEGPHFAEGVIAYALGQAPLFPVYNPDGSYHFGNNTWGYAQTGQLNPVAVANLTQDRVKQFRLLGSAYGEYELLKNLRYRLMLGTDVNNFRRDYFRPSALPNRDRLGASVPVGISRAETFVNWLLEHTLNYSQTFGNHRITGLAGFSSQQERQESNALVANNFPSDLVQTLNAGQVTQGGSRIEEWSLLSFLGRGQYDYRGKYLLSAALRADGSSRFGSNNKWGYFPSFSAGWRIADEPFMGNVPVLSDLKLRASYGFTGNFQIPNYGFASLVGSDNYVLGAETVVSGLTPNTAANPDLRWERTGMLDVGLEMGFFRNALFLEVDYYNSNTSDLLLNVPVPRTSGFATQLQNLGKVNNRGWEFSLSTQLTAGDWRISGNANLAANRNQVKALDATGAPIISTGGVGSARYITQIGQPIASYYLLIQDGVYLDQQDLDGSPRFPRIPAR
jgi:TonB-linked SusC/RagA family outer membrane protein